MTHPSRTLSAASVALVLAACGGGGERYNSAVTDPASGVANKPPTISGVDSQSVAQDASSDVIAFSVSDPEATAVAVVAESANPAVIAAEGVQLIGNGSSRALILTPMDGASGESTVTLIATDGAGLSARQAFAVTVTSEQRSFREMVGSANAQEAESEGEQIVGYSWVDNPEDDESAFDHLFQ